MEHHLNKKVVKIYNFNNEPQLLAIETILRENGIACFSESFLDSTLDAILLSQKRGGEFYVYEEDKEKAETLIKELLETTSTNKAEAEEILSKEAMEVEKQLEEEPKSDKNKTTTNVIVLGLFVAIIMFIAMLHKSSREKYNVEFGSGDVTITNLEGKVDTGAYIRSCYNRGIEKHKLGDYKGAIVEYDRIMEVCPNYGWAYISRGNAKDELGDHKGAIADYDKAISINPKDESAYYNRGLAKGKPGDYKGKIEDYNKAIELKPDYADAYFNRGIAKGKSGDYKGEVEDYNEVIKLKPDAKAYVNRGSAKFTLDDYKGALSDYDKAIELDQKYANAYWGRGIAKDKLGEYKEAITSLEKAIALDSSYKDKLQPLIDVARKKLEGKEQR